METFKKEIECACSLRAVFDNKDGIREVKYFAFHSIDQMMNMQNFVLQMMLTGSKINIIGHPLLGCEVKGYQVDFQIMEGENNGEQKTAGKETAGKETAGKEAIEDVCSRTKAGISQGKCKQKHKEDEHIDTCSRF